MFEKMGSAGARIAVVLTILLAPTLIMKANATDAGDLLSPLLPPVLDNVCSKVDCGKGTCNASSNSTLPYVCECDSGWLQTRSESASLLMFLPCVIPNCTLNYTCSEVTPPVQKTFNPANYSILDPCDWIYCGVGSCNRTSELTHECRCREGYYNLMNVTSFPCFSECTLGMDCSRLGVTVTNRSATLTPSGVVEDASQATSAAARDFSWVFVLLGSLIIIL